MVWVPDLTLRSDFLGLATSLPRVVPSDAVVSVLDSIVPGMVVQKVVLLGSLVAGGLGAARLRARPGGRRQARRGVGLPVESSRGRTVADRSLARADRLGLSAVGPAPHAALEADGLLPAALPVVVVLGSLSASAGVVTAVALVAGAVGGPGMRWVVASGLALAANAPWLVAGFLHAGSATTSAGGSAPFALQAEGDVPAPVAALSLGGIWNGDVVPLSRTGLAGWLTAVMVVALAALGLRAWRAAVGASQARALATCWAVGMAVALLTWALPDGVGWFASQVPGGGVVRDGARMLVLAAPAVATVVGAGAATVVARVEVGVARHLVGAGLVLLPVLLLLDAAWGMGGRFAAVDYPEKLPDDARRRGRWATRRRAGAAPDQLSDDQGGTTSTSCSTPSVATNRATT